MAGGLSKFLSKILGGPVSREGVGGAPAEPAEDQLDRWLPLFAGRTEEHEL